MKRDCPVCGHEVFLTQRVRCQGSEMGVTVSGKCRHCGRRFSETVWHQYKRPTVPSMAERRRKAGGKP